VVIVPLYLLKKEKGTEQDRVLLGFKSAGRRSMRRSNPRVAPLLCLSLFFNGQPLLARLDRGFIRTLFAPYGQPIVVFLFFVKLALRFPRLASTAPLLFHAINNPMALLVCKICSENPAFSEFLAPVITSALLAV
jgi:hypothetical protein